MTENTKDSLTETKRTPLGNQIIQSPCIMYVAKVLSVL